MGGLPFRLAYMMSAGGVIVTGLISYYTALELGALCAISFGALWMTLRWRFGNDPLAAKIDAKFDRQADVYVSFGEPQCSVNRRPAQWVPDLRF